MFPNGFTDTFEHNAWFRLVVVGLAGVVTCGLVLVTSLFVMGASEKNDTECMEASTGETTAEETGGTPLIALEPGLDKLVVPLAYRRSPVHATTTLAAGSDVTGNIDAVPTTLTSNDGGTIPKESVQVEARGVRSTVLLDVCVEGGALGWDDNGTFNGFVIFTDERLEPLTVPVTVTAQSRYIWGLSPLVVFFPFLALAVTSSTPFFKRQDSKDEGSKVDVQRTADVKAWIGGIAAAAAVYSAQGLANASWGGPVATFALIASMYVAATGVTATVRTQVSTGNAATT